MPYDASARARRSGGAGTKSHGSDQRPEFAHDRDRILYCTAFRRLAGKTQVVAVSEYGLYHTRLTHSLKVAQLGRRLAERLRIYYLDRNRGAANDEDLPPNPDLVEAACLAHDLGHPPFGHAGESVLSVAVDEAIRGTFPARAKETRWKAVGGFEGNAQTFRIASYLSSRLPLRPRFGLDLTRATLDAITKYPRFRVHGGQIAEKWGAFELDRDAFEWMREDERPSLNAKQCFEAQLMDWCDDVTYAVHDMIDFYRGGFIPLDRLFRYRRLKGAARKRSISSEAREFIQQAAKDNGWDISQAEDAWQILQTKVEIYLPFEPTNELKAQTQAVQSQLITYLVEGVDYTGVPCRHDGTLVLHTDPAEAEMRRVVCDLLKRLLWNHVILKPALASQQHGHEHIVRGLLTIYVDNPEVLPSDRAEELDEHRDGIRAAADCVASLTEQDAQALYHRMTGVRLGSITDRF